MAVNKRIRQILFFTRLRAAGLFDKKCALEKGRCGNKSGGDKSKKSRDITKNNAELLSKSPYANVNKKSGDYAKMLSEAKKNDNDSTLDKKSIRTAYKRAKGRGKKAYIKSKTTEQGTVTSARVIGEKDVRVKSKPKAKSELMTQELREQRKAASFKLKGKKERAARIAEMAKTNPSLKGEAAKAAKEAKPTAKQKRQFGAAKSRIAKQKKKEGK